MLGAPIVLFMLSSAISGCERGGPAAPNAILSSPAAQRAGARLFAMHCAICHGASADGVGLRFNGMVPPPQDLTLPPWSQRDHARRTYRIIRKGVRGTAMAGWPMLSERQTWQLVAYIEARGQRR